MQFSSQFLMGVPVWCAFPTKQPARELDFLAYVLGWWTELIWLLKLLHILLSLS